MNEKESLWSSEAGNGSLKEKVFNRRSKERTRGTRSSAVRSSWRREDIHSLQSIDINVCTRDREHSTIKGH